MVSIYRQTYLCMCFCLCNFLQIETTSLIIQATHLTSLETWTSMSPFLSKRGWFIPILAFLGNMCIIQRKVARSVIIFHEYHHSEKRGMSYDELYVRENSSIYLASCLGFPDKNNPPIETESKIRTYFWSNFLHSCQALPGLEGIKTHSCNFGTNSSSLDGKSSLIPHGITSS